MFNRKLKEENRHLKIMVDTLKGGVKNSLNNQFGKYPDRRVGVWTYSTDEDGNPIGNVQLLGVFTENVTADVVAAKRLVEVDYNNVVMVGTLTQYLDSVETVAACARSAQDEDYIDKNSNI